MNITDEDIETEIRAAIFAEMKRTLPL